MIVVRRAPIPRSCPRCAGPLYRSYDDEYGCLYCGEYVFTNVPPNPMVERPPVAPEGKRKRGRPRKNPVAA